MAEAPSRPRVDAYDHTEVESKWRRIWEARGDYRTPLDDPARPFYNLMMFPYPSAEGLHVGHIVPFLAQMWLWLTPIVYPISYVPKEWKGIPLRHIYTFNPMVRFAETMRSTLYHLSLPSWNDMLFLAVSSAITLAVGMWVFSKLEGRLAEEL